MAIETGREGRGREGIQRLRGGEQGRLSEQLPLLSEEHERAATRNRRQELAIGTPLQRHDAAVNAAYQLTCHGHWRRPRHRQGQREQIALSRR